jgi:flavorubredoxin
MLEMIAGLGFKNKKAAAFGSYGWSGESTAIIQERLKAAKIEVLEPGLKVIWNPDEDGKQKCFEFGREFAGRL